MYFGSFVGEQGWSFFSFICFGTVLGVTRGEKQGSRLLSLKYDLLPKFSGQLPETKCIEKLVL